MNNYGIDLEKMIKITTGEDSNWALYLKEESGAIYSVAVVEGCNTSTFGNTHHLAKVCRMGYYKENNFTKEGLEILKKYGFEFKEETATIS